MANPRPVGNRTERRGRKLRRDIHIGQEAARSLRILTLNARGVRGRDDITEDQIVEELIEVAWREYDERTQAAAEEAYEGDIL
jgi:hypothetical protein